MVVARGSAFECAAIIEYLYEVAEIDKHGQGKEGHPVAPRDDEVEQFAVILRPEPGVMRHVMLRVIIRVGCREAAQVAGYPVARPAQRTFRREDRAVGGAFVQSVRP